MEHELGRVILKENEKSYKVLFELFERNNF